MGQVWKRCRAGGGDGDGSQTTAQAFPYHIPWTTRQWYWGIQAGQVGISWDIPKISLVFLPNSPLGRKQRWIREHRSSGTIILLSVYHSLSKNIHTKAMNFLCSQEILKTSKISRLSMGLLFSGELLLGLGHGEGPSPSTSPLSNTWDITHGLTPAFISYWFRARESHCC